MNVFQEELHVPRVVFFVENPNEAIFCYFSWLNEHLFALIVEVIDVKSALRKKDHHSVKFVLIL